MFLFVNVVDLYAAKLQLFFYLVLKVRKKMSEPEARQIIFCNFAPYFRL